MRPLLNFMVKKHTVEGLIQFVLPTIPTCSPPLPSHAKVPKGIRASEPKLQVQAPERQSRFVRFWRRHAIQRGRVGIRPPGFRKRLQQSARQRELRQDDAFWRSKSAILKAFLASYCNLDGTTRAGAKFLASSCFVIHLCTGTGPNGPKYEISGRDLSERAIFFSPCKTTIY